MFGYTLTYVFCTVYSSTLHIHDLQLIIDRFMYDMYVLIDTEYRTAE